METVITVEDLGKKYIIGHQQQIHRRTLRGSLAEIGQRLAHPFSRNPDGQRTEAIWALKNISFKMQQGERLGIIGRNGAGKSTLLKILSRITDPTVGRARIRGRIASLLEVGTGFHPELTGRENIFLNGAILGMSRHDIRRKFDEIVAFAGMEKFLDTPVKRYSSGMYMRLAFAVAAHLEPEILVVDEVLAVGDVEFQKKCLGKMKDVGKEGRSILFVSHNMNAIEQFCTSVLLLENGRIKRISKNLGEIVKEYLFIPEIEGYPSEWINQDGREYQNDYFTILKFFISDKDGAKLQMPVRNDSDIWINLVGEFRKIDPSMHLGYQVYTEDGIHLLTSAYTDNSPDIWPSIKKGETVLRSRIPKHFLNEGLYKIELSQVLFRKEFLCYPGKNNPTLFLEIKGGLSQSPYWTEKRMGLTAPILEWTN